MRFYLDENVPGLVARLARAHGLDVTNSTECGQNGSSDERQLRFAAGEGRCLVSVDCKDLAPISVRFAEQALPHAGVLCLSRSVRRSDAHAIVQALVRYAAANPLGVTPYLVDYLRW